MATNPRNAIISQIQSMAPELLKGVDVNALEDVYLNRMLDDAKRLSYGQRELAYNMANPERQYLFENPADYYQAYGTIPVNFQGTSGYYDTKEKAQDIRYLTPDANASYRLVSPKSGQVLGTGTGQQGLLDLATQANRLNTELGREADWQLIQTGPGGDQVIGTNKYNSDRTLLGKIFGPILDVGLPVLGTVFGGPLGAAIGSGVASAANDRSLESALLRAAIAGGTSALMPGGGGAASSTGSQTAGQVAGQAATQAAGQAATQAATQAAGDIVVNAILPSLTSQLAAGGVSGLASSLIPSFFDSAQLSDVAPTQQPSTPSVSPEDIVVTAAKSGFTLPAAAAVGVGAGGLLGATTSPATSTTAATTDKNLLQKIAGNMSISDYLTLAGLVGGAASGLFGGGGGGGAVATSPYTSLLGPAPTLGGAQTATTRQMNVPFAGDYEQYGFGPEYQFFKQPA